MELWRTSAVNQRPQNGAFPQTTDQIGISNEISGLNMAVDVVMPEPLSSLLSGKIQRNTWHSAAALCPSSLEICRFLQEPRFHNREKNRPEQGMLIADRDFF